MMPLIVACSVYLRRMNEDQETLSILCQSIIREV